MDRNTQAFLKVIRYAEGTAARTGYRTLFGGGFFKGYADHPRTPITARLGKRPITSTAAGAYQFLARTWDDIQKTLHLPDFSPKSQDAGALFLIRRRRALDDVVAGRFEDAIQKLNSEWASLPGSPYGQPTKQLEDLKRYYLEHRGRFA